MERIPKNVQANGRRRVKSAGPSEKGEGCGRACAGCQAALAVLIIALEPLAFALGLPALITR